MGARQSMLLSVAAAVLVACQPTIGDAPNIGGGVAMPDAAVGEPPPPTRPDASIPVEPAADAGPDDVTLSQNESDEILDLHSIGCVEQDDDGNPVQNRENSYYRMFDLTAEGITGDLEVSSVRIGVESASTEDGAAQPATVRLHAVAGELELANMTQLATVDVAIESQGGGTIDVPIEATVAAGSRVAVELFVPDSDVGRLFFIGTNDQPQRGPSYIRAPAAGCDLVEPTDLAVVPPGFPDVHIVMSVSGRTF